jgi:glycosyltransferase involved in cell wall biosynthesis
MPIYNSEKNYLEKSIRSCLSQTYKNIELVIVEDGSDKDSEELVRSFSDDRIIYIRKEKNEKLPRALNTGFEISKGEYLSWTSDDNMYMEEAIKTMYNFLIKNPIYDLVYSDWYYMDGEDNIIGVTLNRLPSCLKINNPIGPCFLYKRSVYETVGEYSSEYIGVEDYEYWIRVSKLFNMYPLRKVLYFYRFHSKSLTAKSHTSILLNQKRMLDRYF